MSFTEQSAPIFNKFVTVHGFRGSRFGIYEGKQKKNNPEPVSAYISSGVVKISPHINAHTLNSGVRCRVSGVSAASGRRGDQFDRKKTFVLEFHTRCQELELKGSKRNAERWILK